jgi:hypothetical protein
VWGDSSLEFFTFISLLLSGIQQFSIYLVEVLHCTWKTIYWDPLPFLNQAINSLILSCKSSLYMFIFTVLGHKYLQLFHPILLVAFSISAFFCSTKTLYFDVVTFVEFFYFVDHAFGIKFTKKLLPRKMTKKLCHIFIQRALCFQHFFLSL